jgi:hypothetical protein
MQIKEVILQKGYQLTFTEDEYDRLWFYFHNEWTGDMDSRDLDFQKNMFNYLEDYRLTNLK